MATDTEKTQTSNDSLDSKIVNTLEKQAGLSEAPQLPEGTTLVGQEQEVQQDEMLDSFTDLENLDITPTKVGTDNLEVTAPTKPSDVATTTTRTQEDIQQLGDAPAVTGEVSPEAVIGEIQGQISRDAIAKAATQDLDEKATVKYQLGELYKSLDSDGPLPAWASPAARAANAIMQNRGLGASSMAAAAAVQALMESATPIAAADAQKYATIQLQNLNNEQATALQNAATFAAMDTANLDARLTAAVNNAKTFLTIDVQNLTNEQQASTLTYNAKLQGLFTDAAADNARQQFNAKTQAQVDQFFSELGTQVESANKNRQAAMEQFDADQENTVKQYLATANNAREQFNQNMKLQINQANAVWRRQINTQNNALQNETNRINVQNLLGLSASAQNAIWQKYRDEAAWIFQMTENEAQRNHAVGMAALEGELNSDLYDKQTSNKFASVLGGNAINGVFKYFGLNKDT